MEGVSEMKRGSKPGYIAMLVLNLLAFVALIILTIVNLETVLEAREYDLEIYPADWVFYLAWASVLIALAAITLYALTLACRYNSITCGLLYYDPPFLPPTFFAILIISHVFNITWFYAIESDYLLAAFLTVFALWLCLCIAVKLAVRLLWHYESELSRTEMWINVIVVQNGLSIYATWAAIATVLQLAVLLFHKYAVSMEVTSWICLGIIGGYYVISVVIDDLIMQHLYRYMFAPYVVYILAFAGIVAKNYDSNIDHQFLAVALLGLSIFGLLIKIIVTIYFANRKPTALEKED